MSAFIGNIEDIQRDYIDLVPISLRHDEEYLIIFTLLSKDCEIDLDEMESPEDLLDINKTSFRFVDELWQYFNSHINKARKVSDYYNILLDNIIAYGTEREYLNAYEYLVPDDLADEKAYKAYLIHLIEYYRDDIDKAETPEDLTNSEIMPLDVLNNIWSYYNYNYRQGDLDDREAAAYISRVVRQVWEDKREEYLYFVPEYLRTNHGFLVFLSLMIHEFEITYNNIDRFTDLVDSDKVPLKYLQALGMYMNYEYIDRAPEDFNRELILHMHTIWEMRGTDHAIIMAATHGYNPAYIGGDIFIPGYPITTELAEIIVGITRVFIHSRSRFSCNHVYPDRFTYCHGVIIIALPFINENIRQKIYEVMPAGVRFVFWIWIAAQSDNPEETGELGEMWYRIKVVPLASRGEDRFSENNPANLHMDIEPTIVYDYHLDGIFIHSKSKFPYYNEAGECQEANLLSGKRFFTIFDTLYTSEPIACALKVQLLQIPFMGEGYTGEYIISPSGEYLDTVTDMYPGTSAVRRYYDDYPDEENELIIDISEVDAVASTDETDAFYYRDLAVSGLPIDLQKERFDFYIFKSNELLFYDENEYEGKIDTLPITVKDESETVGSLTRHPFYVFSGGSGTGDYIVSPSGEYLDTIDKGPETVTRTTVINYTPEIEIDFINV